MAQHQVNYLKDGGLPVALTTIDKVVNWGRSNSLWALTYGLACCGIEMMASGASRYDFDRFGTIFRASPRQAELMVVAGTLTKKHAEFIRRLYDQMTEPKWVISMGSCANTGGMFNTYATVQGVDRVIPVDLYLPGCAPRPETLQYAVLLLQQKIRRESASRAQKPKKVDVMRAYTPKDDVQKKPYYTDRYWVAPQVAKSDVSEDAVFAHDLEAIKAKFDVLDAYIQVGQMVVVVNAADNFGVLELMKNELEYNQLSELSAIDWLAQEGKFEIFYQMLSMSKRKRVRVKCKIDEKESIRSVSSLFRSADWSEREMYDMFGVVINNHPFMKRILMPDDWEGFPLRKTYPLQGDEFAQWYEVDKIFGKEAREIIGPENRDPARVDRYDTERFARLGHEVPRGADISQGEPDTPLCYQENEGVFLIQKFDAEKSVVISDRDR